MSRHFRLHCQACEAGQILSEAYTVYIDTDGTRFLLKQPCANYGEQYTVIREQVGSLLKRNQAIQCNLVVCTDCGTINELKIANALVGGPAFEPEPRVRNERQLVALYGLAFLLLMVLTILDYVPILSCMGLAAFVALWECCFHRKLPILLEPDSRCQCCDGESFSQLGDVISHKGAPFRFACPNCGVRQAVGNSAAHS